MFQLNVLSLGEYYGKECRATAQQLLEYGLIDFVASDVHNQKQLEILKELQLPQKTINLLLPILDKTIHAFY